MAKRAPTARTSVSEDALLAAAASLFRAKGFAATTVREIAAAAGVLPGSLHYRFASKNEILVALIERGTERITGAVFAAVNGVENPVERARLGFRAYLTTLLSGSPDIYVLLYEWRSVTGRDLERIIELRDAFESFTDALLREAFGDCGRPQMDLGLLRMFGFGALNWTVHWFKPGGSRTPEQIADAFWAFIVYGVLPENKRPVDVNQIFLTLFEEDTAPLLSESTVSSTG